MYKRQVYFNTDFGLLVPNFGIIFLKLQCILDLYP